MLCPITLRINMEFHGYYIQINVGNLNLCFFISFKNLGIEKTRTTPYRTLSDGMGERFNRTLQDMLSAFVNENRDD